MISYSLSSGVIKLHVLSFPLSLSLSLSLSLPTSLPANFSLSLSLSLSVSPCQSLSYPRHVSCSSSPLAQGSPTIGANAPTTYRRAMSVTMVRTSESGLPFLYTLTVQCPENKWAEWGPDLIASVNSFALDVPSRDFVDPEKDPWRFF
jgi:hypothetical protein